MDQELRKLFDLRWKERDRILEEKFLSVKQEMNGRGVLNSSMTIKNAHKVMTEEFETSRQLISNTIIDFIGKSQRVTSAKLFQDIAQAELANRKSTIETRFASGFESIMSGLQNSSMIAPFVNIDDTFPWAQKELSIELNSAVVAYNRSFGINLTDQLRNRFLNHPIIAVVILAVAGAAFIIGLLNMIGIIDFGE